jgi:GTP 3',8-cyclase
MSSLITAAIPTFVDTDRTLRVKVIDACGMTCTFCHNEGTPVAADNGGGAPGAFRPSGRSGRVSIYAATNGATFLPAAIAPDEDYRRALGALGGALQLSELHLTGGEPTLHPGLANLIALGRDAGFRICMTSNGERGAAQIPRCAEAGLDHVNFSIFGTTPAELAAVQHARYANPVRAGRKHDALRASIAATVASGVKASANIVVPGRSHVERVHRLLDEYAPQLTVRLLNSLAHGQPSNDAIEQLLAERGAVAEARYVTAGVSGARTAYRLPEGRQLFFKQIRRLRLPDTCQGCRFNNDIDCEEGFYGIRLYRDREGTFQVGVCIQRMDLCLPLDEFLASELPAEILRLREADYQQLSADSGSAGMRAGDVGLPMRGAMITGVADTRTP